MSYETAEALSPEYYQRRELAVKSYRPDSHEAFVADPKSQDAILMRLQEIGENLSHIRDNVPEFWNEHATEAWIKAIGLRNIISHGYADVNMDVIWVLVTEDLAESEESVQKYL